MLSSLARSLRDWRKGEFFSLPTGVVPVALCSECGVAVPKSQPPSCHPEAVALTQLLPLLTLQHQTLQHYPTHSRHWKYPGIFGIKSHY